ncbi:hypothetical protein ACA910_019013 [Epithemia clementina (nom. ined.)]
MIWMLGTVTYDDILSKYQKFEISQDDKYWKTWVQQNGGTVAFAARVPASPSLHEAKEGLHWDDGEGGEFEDDNDDWGVDVSTERECNDDDSNMDEMSVE